MIQFSFQLGFAKIRVKTIDYFQYTKQLTDTLLGSGLQCFGSKAPYKLTALYPLASEHKGFTFCRLVAFTHITEELGPLQSPHGISGLIHGSLTRDHTGHPHLLPPVASAHAVPTHLDNHCVC